MSANILKDFLSRQPFESFRERLSSGDVYEIRHAENALFLKSGIAIAIPTESGELPDVPVWCSFLHVAAVEPLSATSSR